MKGISVFFGMNYSLEENLKYINLAAEAGFTHVFTSLHIPEADYSQIKYEIRQIVSEINKLRMSVIADISPNAYNYLGLDPDDFASFRRFGLNGIRLDYGFSAQDIARYSRNNDGLIIEINASTITPDFLSDIIKAGANLKNLTACHNYYPRNNTGISYDSLCKKNQLLKNYDIPVSAFISLLTARRAPLYEGLPTLEFTRNISPQIAMQILFQSGIDRIIIGDSQAEIELLKRIVQINPEVIEFDAVIYNKVDYHNLLFAEIHTNRPDAAEDVIRSQESRLILSSNQYIIRKVTPENCIERKKGSITVDNDLYLRYAGELQICKKDLTADSRVNVIGEITEESCLLLDHVGDSHKFKLNII